MLKHGQKPVYTKHMQKIEKLINLGKGKYACKVLNEDSIMILRVDFDNPDGFIISIDIQEFEGKILEINGDRQMLYALVKVDDEINLKCFIYKNDKLTFLS